MPEHVECRLREIGEQHLLKRRPDSWRAIPRLLRAAEAYLEDRKQQPPTPAKMATAYDKLHRRIGKAREACEAMEPSWLYMDPLEAAFPAEDEWLSENYFDLAYVQKELASLEEWIGRASQEAAKQRPHDDKGGNRGNPKIYPLIYRLANIYEDAVMGGMDKRDAGVAGQFRGARAWKSGPFPRFVEAVYAVLEPDDRRTALAQTIRNALAGRKSDRFHHKRFDEVYG